MLPPAGWPACFDHVTAVAFTGASTENLDVMFSNTFLQPDWPQSLPCQIYSLSQSLHSNCYLSFATWALWRGGGVGKACSSFAKSIFPFDRPKIHGLRKRIQKQRERFLCWCPLEKSWFFRFWWSVDLFESQRWLFSLSTLAHGFTWLFWEFSRQSPGGALSSSLSCQRCWMLEHFIWMSNVKKVPRHWISPGIKLGLFYLCKTNWPGFLPMF